MKIYNWNIEKNKKLKKIRGICFEDIILSINEGKLLDIIKHPNKQKLPNQKIFIVEYSNYAFLVPFVEDNETVFLKTIIPSRKMTKLYLGGNKNEIK